MSSPQGHSKACWNAKGKVCKCKCHRLYHGLGRKNSQESKPTEEGEKREPNFDEIIQKNRVYTLEELF